MKGKITSLNASVSAGIVMYEAQQTETETLRNWRQRLGLTNTTTNNNTTGNTTGR